MRTRGLMVLVLVAAAGCNDQKPIATLAGPTPLTSTGARAYVVQEAGGTADRVTLTIHVDTKDIPMAAYQGRLQFDASAMQVIESTTPSDGTRLINTGAGAGLIKFAGFTTDVFTQTIAATVVVKPLKSLDMANLIASLDVVGEVSGKAVAKSRLLPASGIYSAAAAR